jgi:hypothetical protein
VGRVAIVAILVAGFSEMIAAQAARPSQSGDLTPITSVLAVAAPSPVVHGDLAAASRSIAAAYSQAPAPAYPPQTYNYEESMNMWRWIFIGLSVVMSAFSGHLIDGIIFGVILYFHFSYGI